MWVIALSLSIGLAVVLRNVLSQQSLDNPNNVNGNIDFINSFDPRPPGDTNNQGDIFRITGRNLKEVNWKNIDRRREEGWWHLFPFGERFHDTDIAYRPWNDQQIDLDFFFPYYGFRFNYSFIFPEGFVAFSYPRYVQPPYTFPNPRWPDEYDPSFVAAFMSPQTTMAVGETAISHICPPNMIGNTGPGFGNEDENRAGLGGAGASFGFGGQQSNRYYRGQLLRTQEGRIEDPEFLDQLTMEIRNGMVGARGFTADYALMVTWERMAYGGSPKVTQLNLYDQVKKWQNTYQMIIASDEIRSYVMFNYANINWTSSTSAGALFGRGGKQSALVGFNGGNGTGFVQLPYSAEGNSYKLVQFGSTQTAGRWLARTDENIIYGGCINTSIGVLTPHIDSAPMLGGFALNVSGPCYRPENVIKLQLDILTIDCTRIDMVVARCVLPVNGLFKTGYMDMKLSIDGGKNYPWWTKFYIIEPLLSFNPVDLVDDPIKKNNNWFSPSAENLTMMWPAGNISTNPNVQVDIVLFGYWEDVEKHSLVEIGSIAKGTSNTGSYSFNPRTLTKTDMLWDAWRQYQGGVVQVRVADDWMAERGDGLYWSKMIPLGWYFRNSWEENYGYDWADDLCQDWFDYDGRRINYVMELEVRMSCPCTLDQALADFGRFIALSDCDMMGNSDCHYTKGAQHCVVSTQAVWTGAGQMCCYDFKGWLMFSDDYEYTPEYLRFYGAGVAYRAHPWGSYPFQRPPYVPSLSNFYNDLLPYEVCCKWAGKCEFYYWRRQSSGCQEYKSSAIGFAYGQGHFLTYDGVRFPFQGKGYFVLTEMKGPRHDLMVQARMEQPPKTIWDANVPATIMTGVAAKDNSSATIQVFARKEFRRERYRLDVYVDGVQVFFDEPHKKQQIFSGGVVRNPPRNMNTSDIEIMFSTGVGVKVQEARGSLAVMISLPYYYNETLKRQRRGFNEPIPIATGTGKCAEYVRTLGLLGQTDLPRQRHILRTEQRTANFIVTDTKFLGTFNGDDTDDLITPDCNLLQVGQNQKRLSENEARNVYYEFGEKWRVDGVRHPLLFQPRHKALYDPLAFASPGFQPSFDPFRNTNTSYWQSLVFTPDQVRSTCQSLPSCEYDYMTSGRREIALDTLSYEKKFEGIKRRGEQKLISCGALVKNKGVIKFPIGNNYLDGVTVTFSCKPEYFLHGNQQRTCINGTWSPGWWVWCRSRTLEDGLKWFTGIIVSLLIIAVIAGIFIYCYCLRIRSMKYRGNPNGRRYQQNPKILTTKQVMNSPVHHPNPNGGTYKEHMALGGQSHQPPISSNFNIPVMDTEPKVGIHGSHGSNSNLSGRFMNETSA